MRRLRGRIYFPLIVGIHFAFWAIDLVRYDGDFTARQVVGEAFSSWVVTVLAFNFLMATRARWVERIFGGLDKMYLIHRRSGVLAVVLLLLHFLTVPKAAEFSPGKPLGFLALALILIGVVLSAAPPLKRKLKYAKWLKAHKAMGLFYIVGLTHATLVPTLISQLPIVRTYVVGMAAVGVSAWVYRAFLYRLVNRPLEYTVESVRRLPGRVVEATLHPSGTPLRHAAGQFAFFTFSRVGAGEAHPFSISSPPGTAALRVEVRALGDDTTAMQTGLEVGAKVDVDGPFGCFTAAQAPEPKQLWIAGGIGITPFLSLAPQANQTKDIALYWSVRSWDEAPFNDELEAVAKEHPGFSFELWCSDEKGHLSIDSVVPEGDISDHAFLICGPAALKGALIGQLEARGARASQIHDEEFSFR